MVMIVMNWIGLIIVSLIEQQVAILDILDNKLEGLLFSNSWNLMRENRLWLSFLTSCHWNTIIEGNTKDTK